MNQLLSALKDDAAKANSIYRQALQQEIIEQLSELPEDTMVQLEDPLSEKGLATGEWTDVVIEIDTKGQGIVWNSLDFINTAYDVKTDVIGTLPINKLELVLTSVEKLLK